MENSYLLTLTKPIINSENQKIIGYTKYFLNQNEGKIRIFYDKQASSNNLYMSKVKQGSTSNNSYMSKVFYTLLELRNLFEEYSASVNPEEYLEDRLLEFLKHESKLIVSNKSEIKTILLDFFSQVKNFTPIGLEIKYLLNNEKDITQYFERDFSFMCSKISSNSIENFYQIYCDNQKIVTLNDFFCSKYPEVLIGYLETFFITADIKLSILNDSAVHPILTFFSRNFSENYDVNTSSSAVAEIVGIELKFVFVTDKT